MSLFFSWTSYCKRRLCGLKVGHAEEKMAKALVLGGATGLLGQTLAQVLAKSGWEVECLGGKDGNLKDIGFLRQSLAKAGADVVFNAIAWTQVDDAEDHPEEAMELNRALPDALAKALAVMDKGHLVHYSTDFVFSGSSPRPRKETDPPCPASVYGRSKLAGEEAVLRNLPERSCVLRAAWLFGGAKKNFVDVILDACAKRDVVRVVDDQIGSPTYTLDLANWSAVLAEKRATGIWNAVNSGRASWCELAAEAIALASAPCRIEPIPSSQWPQKALRPEYSVLDNSKLTEFLGKKPRPWPQALRDYIYGEYSRKQAEAKK